MKPLSLLLLLSLPCVALASPADYNASPGYGSVITAAKGGGEVAMEEMELLSEVTEPDGRHLLTYSATVHNTGGGYHSEVAVWLDVPSADWPVEIVTPFAEVVDLPPNSAATAASTSLSLRCSAADATTVKAALASRQHLHVNSRELYQFIMPVIAADEALEDACTAEADISIPLEGLERRRLTFNVQTGPVAALAPGKLILENVSLWELQYQPSESPLALVVRSSEASRTTPDGFNVGHYFEITSILPLQNGGLQVDGIRRTMFDVLRDGSFFATQLDTYRNPNRDPYNPSVGNSLFTAAEMETRGLGGLNKDNCRSPDLADILGLFSMHYAINDIQIAPGMTIDGEFLLKGLNVAVDLKWRAAALRKVVLSLSSSAELDVRLTAEAGSKNDGKPLFEKELPIAHAPLPPIVIPIGDVGIEFWPVLDVKAGCSVDAHARIVVPMQSSMEVGSRMTWDDSQPAGSKFHYEPIQKVTPLAVSEPSLADALSVSASTWVDSSIEVKMAMSYDGMPIVPTFAGPAITAHVQGELTVNPLASPWWKLDASADVRASMRFEFLGIPIADPGFNLFHIPSVVARQAVSPPAPVNGPLDHAAGDHVRWARAIKTGLGGPAGACVARVIGTPEDLFVALRTPIDPSVLMRVNANGDLVWSKGNIIFSPEMLASTPDGGCIVSGTLFGTLFMSKYDGNGNQLWTRDCRLTDLSNGYKGTSPVRTLVREVSGGDYEIFILGSHDNDLNVLASDAFVLKYDSAGTLLWAKEYITPDAEFAGDAALLPNGNLVICGAMKPSPDGMNPPGPGQHDNGWLMIVNPSTGEVLRKVRTDAAMGMSWKSVTAAPGGSIYTTGTISFTVLATLPTLQVGKYDSDLNLIGMVKIGEGRMPTMTGNYISDTPCPLQLPGEAVNIQTTGDTQHPGQQVFGLPDFLPNAGCTVWDVGSRIRWTPAGVVVLGATALGNDTASYALALTDNLSVRWMLAHERLFSGEGLYDLVATDDGIACVGGSSQYFDVATHNPLSDNGCGLIFKLPFDGKVELHRGARGIDKFLQPIVHNSKGSSDHTAIVGPDFLYHGTFVLANPIGTVQTTTGGNAQPSLTPATVSGWVALEAGNPNAPMTFAQWAAYYMIPGATMGDDFDNDGRSNGQEWFFGGDPFSSEYAPPPFSVTHTPGGNLSFTFTKSRAAQLHLPRLESSTDLSNWTQLALPTLSVHLLDAFTEEISFTLPQPADQRRFYRAGAPE